MSINKPCLGLWICFSFCEPYVAMEIYSDLLFGLHLQMSSHLTDKSFKVTVIATKTTVCRHSTVTNVYACVIILHTPPPPPPPRVIIVSFLHMYWVPFTFSTVVSYTVSVGLLLLV